MACSLRTAGWVREVLGPPPHSAIPKPVDSEPGSFGLQDAPYLLEPMIDGFMEERGACGQYERCLL